MAQKSRDAALLEEQSSSSIWADLLVPIADRWRGSVGVLAWSICGLSIGGLSLGILALFELRSLRKSIEASSSSSSSSLRTAAQGELHKLHRAPRPTARAPAAADQQAVSAHKALYMATMNVAKKLEMDDSDADVGWFSGNDGEEDSDLVHAMPLHNVEASSDGTMTVKDRARAIESATLLKDADAMYDSGDKIGVRQLLDGKCADEPEVVWRLARAYYDCAEDKAGSMSKNDKKNLCESALAIITPALEMGPGNYAVHKWYGIILNKVSEFQGTSATIKNSFIVKEHWAKAAALNPMDPTSCALLGEWCYSVAGISGFTRTLAY
jgi:hypothetical protein